MENDSCYSKGHNYDVRLQYYFDYNNRCIVNMCVHSATTPIIAVVEYIFAGYKYN